MRSKHQKRIDEFMKLANQEVPEHPTEPSKEIRILRAKLIFEEAMETIYNGLGITVIYSDEYNTSDKEEEDACFEFRIRNDFNMVETIDGCCDLIVVTTGTLSAIGISDEPFQEEVDNNNLAKFGPGGYRREDGKWCKPPNHQPPRIKEILDTLKIQEDSTMKKAGVVHMEDGETPDSPIIDSIPVEGIHRIKDGEVFLTLRLDKLAPDQALAHCCRMAARAFQHEAYHKTLEIRELGSRVLRTVEGIEQA